MRRLHEKTRRSGGFFTTGETGVVYLNLPWSVLFLCLRIQTTFCLEERGPILRYFGDCFHNRAGCLPTPSKKSYTPFGFVFLLQKLLTYDPSNLAFLFTIPASRSRKLLDTQSLLRCKQSYNTRADDRSFLLTDDRSQKHYTIHCKVEEIYSCH